MSNILMQVQFRSEVLVSNTTMNVLLPDQDDPAPFKVLWLLHGGGGSENDWLHFSKIRSYADKHHIAVVMPYAWCSRYCNMYWGGDYFTFLTEELPRIVHFMYPRISTNREDNYIAGFSLGGSGALSLGLRRSDLYGTIGVLSASSIIPLEHLRSKAAGGPKAPGGEGHMSVNMINFGVEDTDDLKGNMEHDVLLNAKRILETGASVPKIYHAVGQDDYAYPVGLGLKKFFESFESNPFRYEFHTGPGGHNDDFRDRCIQGFLDTVLDS